MIREALVSSSPSTTAGSVRSVPDRDKNDLLTFGANAQLRLEAKRPNSDVGRDSQRDAPPGRVE